MEFIIQDLDKELLNCVKVENPISCGKGSEFAFWHHVEGVQNKRLQMGEKLAGREGRGKIAYPETKLSSSAVGRGILIGSLTVCVTQNLSAEYKQSRIHKMTICSRDSDVVEE